jgi:uncharacterized protein (TIGR03437 family)
VLALTGERAEWIAPHSRIATVLAGARAGVRGEGEGPLAGVVNYWLGRDKSRWIRNVPTYERVRYRGIYPGIDLIYYAKDGRLEYDFEVAPGADPHRIAMRFEGVERVHVDAAGDLVLDTPAGELRQHLPAIYQDGEGARRAIRGRYVLRGGTVRLEVARYDRSRRLVVDPALTWATYFGFGTADSGESIALDSSGNVYVVGTALTTTGYTKVYFAKLNPTGTSAIFTNVYGGESNDYGHAVAVDASGNMYIAGETTSGYFYADTTYLDYYPGYSDDAFITKVDPTGTEALFSHYYGGGGTDAAYGLALDSSDNVYMVGSTNSSGSAPILVSTGAAQTNFGGGNSDAFVVAFSAGGVAIYGTYLGGSGDDYGNGIAADSSGNAYVTGSTTSTNFPVTGSVYQSTNKGAADAFVSKLAPSTGALEFSTYLGGSGADYGYGIALDASGAIYVAGETASTDFPILGAYQSSFGGGTGDAFVSKLSGNGTTLVYSTYLGGSAEDGAAAVAVDKAGNAYITGGTASTNFPVSNAFQATNAGASNAFVAGLNASGAGLLFASYLGGSGTEVSGGTDYGNGVAVNCAAGLVAIGTTQSTDFPVTAGALSPSYLGGASNAFVAMIGAGGGIPAITPGGVVNGATFSSAPVAPGSFISIFGAGLSLVSQQAASAPWPATLAGVTVSIDGTSVPIYYVSSGQINVQLPYETGTGTAVISVASPCGTSTFLTFQVAQAAPYILQTGSGAAIVQNQDYSLNGPNNPAAAGSVITVYMIGIGPLDHAIPTGAAAPSSPLSNATLPKSATIGGMNAPVYFLGMTPGYVGLAQANLTVPAAGSGSQPVVITVGGVASNGPAVYVK